jgi:hypothetical protein
MTSNSRFHNMLGEELLADEELNITGAHPLILSRFPIFLFSYYFHGLAICISFAVIAQQSP